MLAFFMVVFLMALCITFIWDAADAAERLKESDDNLVFWKNRVLAVAEEASVLRMKLREARRNQMPPRQKDGRFKRRT